MSTLQVASAAFQSEPCAAQTAGSRPYSKIGSQTTSTSTLPWMHSIERISIWSASLSVGGRVWSLSVSAPSCQGPIERPSRTTSQPDGQSQVVSMIIVPGM